MCFSISHFPILSHLGLALMHFWDKSRSMCCRQVPYAAFLTENRNIDLLQFLLLAEISCIISLLLINCQYQCLLVLICIFICLYMLLLFLLLIFCGHAVIIFITHFLWSKIYQTLVSCSIINKNSSSE